MILGSKTKRVRFKVSIAGSDERGRPFSHSPGDVVDLDAALAKKFCRAGHCEETDQPPRSMAEVFCPHCAAGDPFITYDVAVESMHCTRCGHYLPTEEKGDLSNAP